MALLVLLLALHLIGCEVRALWLAARCAVITIAQASNSALAARARDHAARSPRGSPDRMAGNCLSACLVTTASAEAARKALGEIESPAIRARARALLGELLACARP